MSCKNNIVDSELLLQIKRKVEDVVKDTNYDLLMQNKKIADLHLFLRDNLDVAIRKTLDALEANGELDTIINSVISELDNNVVYYGSEIYTESFHDKTSNTDYFVTHIPSKDTKGNPINLRVGIANDDPSMSSVESTIEFANRTNSTVAINAGFFDVDTDRPLGIVIKDGEIINDSSILPKYNYVCIDSLGILKHYPYNTPAQKMVDEGVVQAVAGSAILIDSYNIVTNEDDRLEPRQAIGQTATGEIIILTVDGRHRDDVGMSFADLSRIFKTYNVRCAYNLDGGGSSSTVLRGIKQNDNIDFLYEDRAVSNFIYVAKPMAYSENQVINDCYKEIGKLKQMIIKELVTAKDFESGYLRLRGPANYYVPGIEMYVNNEDTRRSKWGVSIDKANIRNSYAYISMKGDTTEKTNLFRVYDQGVWVQTYHGLTGSRPNGVVGLCYFDEGLGKPIWYNGTAWIDANGVEV